LGSNLGDSLAILQAAWRDLQTLPATTPVALSSPYRSQPLAMESANVFINAAAIVRTRLVPSVLLDLLHAIEQRYGRTRDPDMTKYQDRTLDLDLLLYADLILNDGNLVLPHPRMTQRLFVLVPLAEIARDLIHPLCQKRIGVLLSERQKSLHDQETDRISWSSFVQQHLPGQE
jgi:2-amino-4-hydroxy-6-hydroxymethyldihydropteridine diphosphokinase